MLRLDGTDPGGTMSRGSPRIGQMTIRPVSAGLSAARARVRHLAGEIGVPREDSDGLLLAVGEALSNAYLHGTPDPRKNLIRVAWRFANEVLTITVKDEGRGFVPHEAAASIAGSAGTCGHGLRLMRTGVDEVHFEFDDGAAVILKKRLDAGVLRQRSRRDTV